MLSPYIGTYRFRTDCAQPSYFALPEFCSIAVVCFPCPCPLLDGADEGLVRLSAWLRGNDGRIVGRSDSE
eukprot:gene7043-biopygen13966